MLMYDKINIVKCHKIPWVQGNLPIQFNPSQDTNGVFHKTLTKNSKICMNTLRPWISRRILRKKNKVRSITLSGFKV